VSDGTRRLLDLRLGHAYRPGCAHSRARRVLDKAFGEVPARVLHTALHIAYPRIASAEVHLAVTQVEEALSDARQTLVISQEGRLFLEEGAARHVLGQVHEAMGNRAEADAEFHRSLAVLEGIQSRPELGQTLLVPALWAGQTVQ
jgi:hypothetical protein